MLSNRPKAGVVFEDLWKGRLVRFASLDRDNRPANDGAPWVVTDLLSEKRYSIPRFRLSQVALCEMQVLAFVADTGRCPCCRIDGSRLHTISSGVFCSSCYRNACDHHDACRTRDDA